MVQALGESAARVSLENSSDDMAEPEVEDKDRVVIDENVLLSEEFRFLDIDDVVGAGDAFGLVDESFSGAGNPFVQQGQANQDQVTGEDEAHCR